MNLISTLIILATTTGSVGALLSTTTAAIEATVFGSCDFSVTTADSIAFPSGALQIVSTDGATVSFSINQRWKTSDSISWIAPIYTPVGGSSLTCEGSDKVDEVSFEQTIGPFTAQCSDGFADVVVAVHDGSFKKVGVANEDVYGCDGWPKPDGVAVYNLKVPCCESDDTTAVTAAATTSADVEVGETSASISTDTIAGISLPGSCDFSIITGDSIPFPSGALQVDSTDGATVTFSINQRWKTSDSISWIAPIYIPVGGSSLTCEGSDKVDEVSFEQTVGPFTAQCLAGIAEIVVAVHDGSFTQAGVANEDIYGCDGWPKPDGVAVYILTVPCSCESDSDSAITAAVDATVSGSCDYSVVTDNSIVGFPSGALQVEATDGLTVSFTISQLWKLSGSISWIAPIYTPVGGSSLTCEGSDKVDEVSFEQTIGPFTAQCSDGFADVVVAVHDGSFTQAGVANEDIYGCDGWPKPDGVAVYNVRVPCCESSTDTEIVVEPDTHCDGDITLLDIQGSTSFDVTPFSIVSQDTDSVTLKLRALWFGGANVQYTQYSENFVEKCTASNDVTISAYEEITVSCPGTEHIALVSVVGSGTFLDAALDIAEAPQCCHADGDNSPKVKFTFMVSCVSQCPSEARRLRGATK